MPSRPLFRRLTALATASTLALASGSPAWSAPPPIPSRVDPPSRVARLSRLSGTVSFHTADADSWSPASLNYPVSTGDAFWTEPGARADIQLAVNRLVLAPATELDVSNLDDHALAVTEPQGELYLALRQVPAGDGYAIQTPRVTVQITASGRYDVVAGDADHPTLVTVVDGAAQITGPNLSLQVGPRQTATITGGDAPQGSVGPLAQDAFLTAVLAEEQPARRATVAIPPIVQQMTGAEDLDTEGTWQETPQYGTVWYPPVDPGWVPYRHGHWSYVAPWGWTWVDDASWGFAPFHYGRWVEVDNRWGWIPVTPGAVPVGPVPVYAPALVSFVDLGGAAIAGAAVGFAAGRAVGWVPLGPREAYYPPYRANIGYVRSLNAPNIQNVNQSITTVTNRSVVNNFVNRGAATVVPAAAMIRSSPVAGSARPLAPDQFVQARAQARPPFSPGPATAGVTPAVARQFNFAAPARPAQPVPGPAIRPGPHGTPSLGPAHLAASPPGTPPAAEPGRPAGTEPGRAVGAEPGRLAGAELGRPAGAEPGHPVGAEPGRPARSEPGRPPATEPSHPPAAEPPRPAAPAAAPHPEARAPAAPPVRQAAPPAVAAPRPAPPPRVAPVTRPPAPVFHAPPPPRPAAPPPRPAAPPPRPAAPPPRSAAPPHPAAPRPGPPGPERHR